MKISFSKKGFTLMEIGMTMTLMGILTISGIGVYIMASRNLRKLNDRFIAVKMAASQAEALKVYGQNNANYLSGDDLAEGSDHSCTVTVDENNAGITENDITYSVSDEILSGGYDAEYKQVTVRCLYDGGQREAFLTVLIVNPN